MNEGDHDMKDKRKFHKQTETDFVVPFVIQVSSSLQRHYVLNTIKKIMWQHFGIRAL